MNNAAFIFPAVKGIQANREYYISMVPLEVIPRIFQFIDEELPVEVRSQRVLNKSRIPEIRDYILENLDNYVFSSLTVSVDGDMEFTSVGLNDPSMIFLTVLISIPSDIFLQVTKQFNSPLANRCRFPSSSSP